MRKMYFASVRDRKATGETKPHQDHHSFNTWCTGGHSDHQPAHPAGNRDAGTNCTRYVSNLSVPLSEFPSIRISARFADALNGNVTGIHVCPTSVCAANNGIDDHYHASTRAFHATCQGCLRPLISKNT